MIQSLAPPSENRTTFAWLAVFGLIGVVLVILYADADQQDAGYHYLFARWSWSEPYYLIGVWTRPLFTLIYSVPAQFGYRAAKLFTLLVSLITAWQSVRLARRLKLDNAALTVPLLLLQPACFLLFTETQTESIFALLLVVAIRVHYSGRSRLAMILISMLALVRPEGFFIGVAWGVLVLQTSKETRAWRRLLEPLWLATGVVVWWIAAAILTGDPLWIVHDWPADWLPMSGANGSGPLLWYFALLPLIVGPVFLPQFFFGLTRLIRSGEFLPGVISFITLFVAHSLMFWRGWFGAAGYPRYLVCVAPVTAIISLVGWNELKILRGPTVRFLTFGIALLVCLFYVDGFRFTRDSRAIDDAAAWLDLNPVPISRLVYSQSYMCIRLSCSNADRGRLTANREHNLEVLKTMPGGTLLFWDAEVGPKWYGLSSADFEALGYRKLFSKTYRLEGYFFRLPWRHHGGPRTQAMHLYYR